ncbi:TRAP transporter substrate-binding protein [Szabonella alba]|uniref:DctP family TRAP transporter solute-binding subunit n=1 Tax=Szabonella alba TaxID=2804194 RepID=A0A8K0Y2D6_9RHOB|nr:DctP family TRAP transporter solute-binding subunit [Szabonella alba]MBL4919172.1 DctP family TRAP transporter solute-binding subunit [Szabonella alba]
MKKAASALVFGAVMTVATASASAQTIIKLGHFGPGTDAFSNTVAAFAEEVATRSEGRLEVQIFPAGQLGNERQQISGLQGGLQEMMVTAATNVTNMHAPLRLLDLPFAFASHAQTDAIATGPFSRKLLDGLERHGLAGLALWENGFRVMTNSRNAIRVPADVEGLRMRVIGAPVFIDTFTALGTQPVPMPFTELYTGLETGTVEGQDNTAMTIGMMRLHEVQKHVTITNHMYSAMIVLAGQPFLARLTPEDRALLEQVTEEFGPTQRRMMRDAGDAVMTFLKEESGLEVVEALTPEAHAAFREKVAPVAEASVTEDLQDLHAEMRALVAATAE